MMMTAKHLPKDPDLGEVEAQVQSLQQNFPVFLLSMKSEVSVEPKL
jgi:hypothetical protein